MINLNLEVQQKILSQMIVEFNEQQMRLGLLEIPKHFPEIKDPFEPSIVSECVVATVSGKYEKQLYFRDILLNVWGIIGEPKEDPLRQKWSLQTYSKLINNET